MRQCISACLQATPCVKCPLPQCLIQAPVHARQVTAIFGFCDIRNFTDATEVLQEDIMEFVNSIAKIVHMEVSLHGGFPNKNIGDAFLLVCQPESKNLFSTKLMCHA